MCLAARPCPANSRSERCVHSQTNVRPSQIWIESKPQSGFSIQVGNGCGKESTEYSDDFVWLCILELMKD
jgi:hypothetical protein